MGNLEYVVDICRGVSNPFEVEVASRKRRKGPAHQEPFMFSGTQKAIRDFYPGAG